MARTYPVLAARVQAELTTSTRSPDLQAWQLAHQALSQQSRRDHGGYLAALELCEAALLRDPTLLIAHLARGLCAYDATLHQWVRPELGRAEGLDRVVGCIEACLPEAEACGVTLILENHYKDDFW
ncbi:MAG TPA: hypothetical protein PK095_06075, partial [Myxococcota bacterium]|nr:hypothetical protein [Myxococcota bacterium]